MFAANPRNEDAQVSARESGQSDASPAELDVCFEGQPSARRFHFGNLHALLLLLGFLGAESAFGQTRGHARLLNQENRATVAAMTMDVAKKTGLEKQELWADERYPFPARKLDRRLRLAWQTASEQGKAAAVRQLVSQKATLAENGEDVAVIAYPSPGTTMAQLESAIKAAGAAVVRSGPDTVKAGIAIDRLDAAAQLPAVSRIRSVLPPREKNVTTTEGVSTTLANAWHTAGFRGSGVKVAVVDIGFANLATLKAQDEIPLPRRQSITRPAA